MYIYAYVYIRLIYMCVYIYAYVYIYICVYMCVFHVNHIKYHHFSWLNPHWLLGVQD